MTVTVNPKAELPIGYRWRRGLFPKGHQLLFDHTASYTIPAVQLSDAGPYDVVVTNAAFPGQTFTSDRATLTVTEP